MASCREYASWSKTNPLAEQYYIYICFNIALLIWLLFELFIDMAAWSFWPLFILSFQLIWQIL